MTQEISKPDQTSPKRALALDALRGFAILTMLLSGQIPFHTNVLPAWMYHAQVPPPDHNWISTLPGITWVDLVFPFFLFAMGAAFPLALSKRIEKGIPAWKISLGILERGFLLGFFALYVQAIRPYTISKSPTTGIWLLSLLSFFLLFLILTRFPESWNRWIKIGLKSSGWLGAILILALLQYPDGSGFSLYRSDIIIVVLTNMAFFGSFVWLFTRNSIIIRLGIFGILIALRLSNMPLQLGGWVTDLWNFSPIPWIYKLYYLQYLFIVIPGMITGEMILKWINTKSELSKSQWEKWRLISIAILMFIFVLEMLIGLFSRWVIETTLLSFALCGLTFWLMAKPSNETEKLYKELFLWGAFWLILGLFFEPYEGGIKKDKATISYYFVTSGLAICSYIFFSIIIDVFKRNRLVKLFIDNGQNPMIAYAGINNFIIPVLAVTSGINLLNSMAITPWLGFLKGLIITLLLALFVSLCTNKKIFWRT
jgi:predicted acyltransferase